MASAKLSPAQLVSQHGAAAATARLNAAPTPATMPTDIVELLSRHGKAGERALARLRHETIEYDELQAQVGLCDERLYKLGERKQEILVSQQRHEHQRPSGEAEWWQQQARRIEAEATEVRERFGQLRAQRDGLLLRARPLSERLERVRHRIRNANRGGEPLKFIAPPAVDRKKLTLDAVRERILQLGADVREIEAAPRTAAEVKQAITAWVDDMTSMPQVQRLFDPEMRGAGVYVPLVAVADAVLPNALGVLLWACRDQIIRALHADADHLADDAHALDDATRAKKLADCKGEILEAERFEEQLVWEAMQAGEAVTPRAAADVRAILSIA